MKKKLFVFTIAAASAALVACGSKSAQNADAQDSAAVAQDQPVETTAAVVKTIDKAGYSLGIPEGWAVMSADDIECFVYKGSEATPSEALRGTWLSLKIGPMEGKTLEATVQEMVKEMGAKQLDDVTIGGTTYKQCSYVEDGEESRILMTGDDRHGISFMMAHATPDDPDVQAIVSSLKLK